MFSDEPGDRHMHRHATLLLPPLWTASHLNSSTWTGVTGTLYSCRSFAVVLKRWVEFVRHEDRREDHAMFGVLRARTDDSTCCSIGSSSWAPVWTDGAGGRQSSRRQTAWR